MNRQIEEAINETYDAGWIDLDGHWHGSEGFYTSLWEIAKYELNATEAEVNSWGWLCVNEDKTYKSSDHLTPAQQATIKAMGLKPIFSQKPSQLINLLG